MFLWNIAVTPLVGVWIEIYHNINITQKISVTPLVGVWIEINCDDYRRWSMAWSLPLWECGLKSVPAGKYTGLYSHSPCGSVDWNSHLVHLYSFLKPSLPLWECGLKLLGFLSSFNPFSVTPLVGVWIEINHVLDLIKRMIVTPLVGVWIEIFCLGLWFSLRLVTPLVGVWIEIAIKENLQQFTQVTPLVGVWIEIFFDYLFKFFQGCHSPCGSVDWNVLKSCNKSSMVVTPLVGVWIEMMQTLWKSMRNPSLPLWECGLKCH